jgi:hypothetical protein
VRQTKQQLHALAFAALGMTFAAGATLGVAPASAGQARRRARRAKAPRRAAVNVITVASVSARPDGSTRIVLTGARAFRPELRSENGATVAVKDARLADGAGSTLVDKNGVGLVRYAASAGRVEVVASPAPGVKALPASLQGSPDGKRWEVSVWAPQAAAARAEGRYPELVARTPAAKARCHRDRARAADRRRRHRRGDHPCSPRRQLRPGRGSRGRRAAARRPGRGRRAGSGPPEPGWRRGGHVPGWR